MFAPGKNGYDFFKKEFPTGDMTVYAPSLFLSLSLSLSLSHTHTLPYREEQSVARLTKSQRSRVRYPVRPHTFVSPSTNSRRPVVSYWRKYVHEGLNLSRKSFARLTNRPDMTTDVNRGRKITTHTNTVFPRGKSIIPVFA